MATWVVGDVQGCLASLEALLGLVRFAPTADRLWLVGDLVNRGPSSLGVLRRLRDLGGSVTAVLGNHDLHLLGVAAGLRKLRRRDTLAEVLDAPDRDELLEWLGRLPLAHAERVDERPWLMIHAGLHPRWDVVRALDLAGEVAAALHSERRAELLAALADPAPTAWDDELEGGPRLAAITAWLTLARACTPDGTLMLRFTDPPEELADDALPWWDVPGRASAGADVLCGHWAAAGLREAGGVRVLDTGCVWGGSLTALRLEDGAYASVPCSDELPGRS